jgi:uncharacterized repeat protein (TIGR03843 family)
MNMEEILLALLQGELDVQGQFLRGSNYTFLATLTYKGEALKVVYKPVRGEQPLWDFPTGSLGKREVAAYLVSEALGWVRVPPTVFRRKGPLGPGSLQQYIEHDPNYHYFTFSPEDRQRLRPTVLFDLLLNNADRKGSHVLVDANQQIWLIDQGLTFNIDDKLRTVIWDFAGEPIPAGLINDLNSLVTRLEPGAGLREQLLPYLSAGEVRALAARTRRLLESKEFPIPTEDRRVYPWPPV